MAESRMTDIEHVERICAYTPKRGDKIIVTLADYPGGEALHRIADQLREVFPDQQVIVLPQGTGFEVVSEDVAA